MSYPPDLAQYVKKKVASGQFASEDEFALEAAKLYRELEQRHERLRADVQHALDQLDRGEGVELCDDEELQRFFDDIKARGRKRLGAEQHSK